MTDLPPQVLGPLGALALALMVALALARAVLLLWREHLQADADDRAQRDRAMALAEDAVDGAKRMATAWEERNRRDASRARSTDR